MWKESIRLGAAVTIVLALAAGGCASTKVTFPAATGEPCLVRPHFSGDLLEQYNASIFDAAVFRSCRRYGGLEPVDGPAVMGSFISCWRCEDKVGNCSSKCLKPGKQTMPSDVWVSHVDEVLEHCSQFDDVVLGMQQLQGLPPQEGQPTDSWSILVVDVPGPQVLFRPCADPDPTNPGPCGEKFPEEYPCYDPAGCQGVDLEAKMVEHRSWIAGQAFSAWKIPKIRYGYPWTRQGYTYNWSADAATIVGTSEYVIPGGTEIRVCARVTATEFCRSSLAEIEALCE